MADTKYHWCNNGDNGNHDVHPKKAWKTLRQASSVYDLPSTEQAIKRMHTGKINLAQSHQSGQLHGLANAK
jgi:hypothetical protein